MSHRGDGMKARDRDAYVGRRRGGEVKDMSDELPTRSLDNQARGSPLQESKSCAPRGFNHVGKNLENRH